MASPQPPGASGSILRQPMAVWATAFAAVVAFMGIGLVDLILPSIAADLAVIAYGSKTVIVTGVIVSGALLGINNTVFTEPALEVSDAPRPVASAGYNFVRWFAAAGVLVATRHVLAGAARGHDAPTAASRPVPAPVG